MSKNDDLVRRLHEAVNHALMTLAMPKDGAGKRAWQSLVEARDEALDAIERRAAQEMGEAESRAVGAFVYAMQEPQASANGKKPELYNTNVNYVIRRALEAALSTPPAPAPDAGDVHMVPCAQCGKPVDTREVEEGGDPHGAEMTCDGVWVCSISCYAAFDPSKPSPTPQPPAVEAEVEKPVAWRVSFVPVTLGNVWHYQTEEPVHRENMQFVGPLYSEAALKAKTDEIERLRRELGEAREGDVAATGEMHHWREQCMKSDAELNAVSAAIGSARFMDPPDGGDVSLAEQVRRMITALEATEASNKALREELIERAAREGLLSIEDINEVFGARALLSEKGGE